MPTERSQRARALVSGAAKGVLCTNSLKKPGFPFGSATPFAVDPQGRPLLLLSGLAVHTKNLDANSRASLFVAEESGAWDLLSQPRANLFGRVIRLEGAEAARAKEDYLALHPDASQWMDFGDFALYRLAVEEIYFVGGFGEMGWVTATDYRNSLSG